ncbi:MULTISPECIES: indole-3-glycerol phosphate synthase TrpC [unclassified Bacillus (in: firmicutes)]|uniref:indole-3-glycerol phosphate synthase TrpC n=1 Tax=unclassified Bacillus (in: firmicutes) TaxID=185979 RepID=UPI0008E29B96|nr:MULTISPECIES: indole-3-glycerol phosphate synthase TrpC [unclassified Bacillus (in: firmicutes)]SFA91622.1 indole-3-glycerol phosphate synthase [Bacillus sp. UNCCL13]SFQ85615.1 indole-3-glycerol phosphate synthase [Bacillus sp. cl95]
MTLILEKIIRKKRQEVLNLYETFLANEKIDPRRSLTEKMKTATEISVIAEFKRASPSKGVINGLLDPVTQGSLYEENGAVAISVLTDQTFFQGSFNDLKAIRESVQIPILCKDFMIDEIQIDVAASYGADVILLIAAALPESKLESLYSYAKAQGLEILVEVHDEEELERAINLDAELIGINNRNLKTFEVNLDVTKKLAPLLKDSGAIVVSESGIRSQQDVMEVIHAGAQGILVGETMMLSENIARTMKQLRLPLTHGASL